MKIIAAIPARFNAERFPGKLMQLLGDKTVIQTTYEAVCKTKLFDDVYVVTDSKIILNHIKSIGGKVFKSKISHSCGSNRIAEFAFNIDADIIINIQGDEPFINKKALRLLIKSFKNDSLGKIDVISLKSPINDKSDLENSNVVKVVTDLKGFAIYFSRSCIPHYPDKNVYRHIGVYAFRKKALIEFYETNPTPLEVSEKIEALRYIEMGNKILMIETNFMGIGIDSPKDLALAKKYLEKKIT